MSDPWAFGLIQSAALNGLDPEAQLRTVLTCIAEHPAKTPVSIPGIWGY